MIKGVLLLCGSAAASAILSPVPVHAQQSQLPAVRRDARTRTTLITFAFQSAQMQAAESRASDARLRALRQRIDARDEVVRGLRIQLRAERRSTAALVARIETLVAEADQDRQAFMDQLAARDETFARDRAILLSAGERLLATREGAAALERYNQGGPGAYEAADRVFAQLEAQRQLDRQQRSRAQHAQDRRERALFAQDAFLRGLAPVSAAIARFDAVLEIEPDSVADLLAAAQLNGLVDLWRSLAFVERALALRIEDPLRFQTLVTACQQYGRLGDIAQGSARCTDAERLARSIISRGGPEVMKWRHRAVMARLFRAYVHYAWSDTAEADRLFSEINEALNQSLRDPIDYDTFIGILVTLTVIAENRYRYPMSAEKTREYVDYMSAISVQLNRISGEYDRYPNVRMLRHQVAASMAQAQFYFTRERRYLDEYVREVRSQTGLFAPDAANTALRGIDYETNADLCRMYALAEDHAAAERECSTAIAAIAELRQRPAHPAEQLKLDMDMAQLQAELATELEASGNRERTIAANQSALENINRVLGYPGLASPQTASWRESFVVVSMRLAGQLVAANRLAEAGQALEPALPFAREAAGRSDAIPQVERNLLGILILLAEMGHPGTSWGEVARQYEDMERRGMLGESDRAARARATERARRQPRAGMR